MMTWTISHAPDSNIVCVETQGEVTAEELNRMVQQVREVGLEHDTTRFLVDHRKAAIKLKFIEVYDRPRTLDSLGFPRNSRIAQVFPESEHGSFEFFETVSQNMRYEVRIFKDTDSATAWLVGRQG